MRKTIVIIAVAVFFIATLAYAKCVNAPGPDGAALWEYIHDYTSWNNWPEHSGMQPGKAPHGKFHVVYVNDKAAAGNTLPLANGAVVVKENYSPEKNLTAITVMYKIEGYNTGAGDWFWVKYAPDGTVQKEGKPGGCIGCHSPAAANDFVIIHTY